MPTDQALIVSRVKLKDTGRIVGYAYDNADPDTPLTCEFWFSGTLAFQTDADLARPQGAPAGAPDRCGFNIRPSRQPGAWLADALEIRARGKRLNRSVDLVRDQLLVQAAAMDGERLLVQVRVPSELQRLFVARAVVDGVNATATVIAQGENHLVVCVRTSTRSAFPTVEIWTPRRTKPVRTPDGGIDWLDLETLLAGSTPVVAMSEARSRRLARASALPRVTGRLEGIRKGSLVGWAFDPDHPGARQSVDIFVDGLWRDRATADRFRGDLEAQGVGDGFHTFQWPLPDELADHPAAAFSIVPQGGFKPLAASQAGKPVNELIASSSTADDPFSRALDAKVLRAPSVAIVVPVFNAAEATRRCIQALLAHTTTAAELIVIDDASTDPTIGDILRDLETLKNVRILRNATNQGFTRSVNRGIEAAGRADVVLLNSDARVGPRWLQGLGLAAHRDPRTASATAVSNNAGPFSVPIPAALETPDGSHDEIAARRVAQAANGAWIDTPTGHGFCMYIRRDGLDDVGGFDAAAFPRGYGEENDWSMRASRRGWRHVVDHRTLVFHERSASFGDEKAGLLASGRKIIDERYPDYTSKVRTFSAGADLKRIGGVVQEAFEQHVPTPARPRVLYVINKETGGTPQTNRDLMGVIADEYEPMVLRFDRDELSLSVETTSGPQLLAQHRLSSPVDPLSHRSAEYDRVLAEWLTEFAVEMVHVRHIGWHSLGLFRVLNDLAIPVIFSFHDFYAVCPSLKLLDDDQRFCGGVCTGTEGSCAPELWQTVDLPPLKHGWVHVWRAQMSDALASCDGFVTTSPFAKSVLLTAHPTLADKPFPVIAHGRDFHEFRRGAGRRSAGEPLRIVVPGNIGIPKGARLIHEVKRLDIEGRLEFHILGQAHQILSEADVVLHGAFEREQIIEQIARLQPHVGGVFSIWPETYCHTLTELWAAGVPVVAFDLGALGERMRESGGGWLLTDPSPQAVYESLLNIARDDDAIVEKTQEVMAWQTGLGRTYGVRAMADRYGELYRTVLDTRRVLQVEDAVAAMPLGDPGRE